MSDNPTQEIPDSRSFEERVFARFDTMDMRLTTLEEKVDSRLRETRPIWEAMQADLAQVKSEVKDINRGMKLIHKDIFKVRVNEEEQNERLDKLDGRVEKLESQSTR
jgi:septal ring factor EnvC (AmiA/AmiB activator)